MASERTESGHRLYSDADVERLYRISLLRRLGLPLRDIARALDDPAWSLQSALAAHLAALDRRLEAARKLRSHLAALLSAGDVAARGDELLEVLEEMTTLETAVQRRVSVLVYADLEAAYEFLVRVFGLGPGDLSRDSTGRVVHGELQVGDGVVWLHRETAVFGLSSPRSLARPPPAWRL